MTEETGSKWISGFWRRVGAFVIDLVILGAFGIALGLFLEEQFVQLGAWGRLIGFFVALIYFGFLNSRMFGGQTIGKKLCNIRVAGKDNQSIDLLRSFARYSILGVPFFLNGAHFTSEAMTSFWIYPISLLVFGGLISVAYLYIFNRTTRQSLHDLIVGTYVVNATAEKQDIGAFWRPHWAIVALVLIASALLPVLTSNWSQNALFKDLLSARTALSAHPAARYVGVSSGTTSRTQSSDGMATTSYLSAQVVLKSNSVSDAELAKQLATILANSHTNAGDMDVIQVVLTYGYDIGIASSWSTYHHTYRPADLINQD